MYIPSKPAKYGIKFFMVNDAESRYCMNSFPYLGKGSAPVQEDQNQGHYFVKELLTNLMEPGRTLCHDSWFTSVPLAKDLLNSGIHTVGTIRPKPYLLSKHTLKNIQLPIGESVATFHHEDKINVVYKRTKSAKFVNLLTTIHNRLTNVEHGKTEAHMWYNASKGGTDTFDQMCWITSCNRKTARWPLCAFYALLNIVVNNAWIIYHHRSVDQERTDKIDFMQNMAYELCLPYVQDRHRRIGKYLPRPIHTAMETVFNVDRQQPELQQQEPADDDHQGPARRRRPRPTREMRERTVLRDSPPVGNWTGTGFTEGRIQCKYCDPKKTKTFRYTCSSSQCGHQNVCMTHAKVICKSCWLSIKHEFHPK